jgi:phosphohistidine swiveling domain-containing protein
MADDERRWVVDDRPNDRFTVWTRGNVGEVFPAVVSPLTWSLFGADVERGWRDAFAGLGALGDADYGDIFPANVGVFGGYCYLNVSTHRVFAVRTPGLTPEQMDRAIFGESEAPPYAAAPGDKSLGATLRMVRSVATTLFAKALPELDEDKREVAEWLARQPDPATATDEQLRATMDGFRSMWRRLFGRHIGITFRSTVPTGVLTQLCAEKLGDPGLVVQLLGGIGEVESAEPAKHLWRLGRLVEGDAALGAHFDAGLDGLAARLAADPAAAAFLEQVGAFQARFGARGPNEWEGSSPTWGTDPGLVLAAVDAMRKADGGHDPDRLSGRLAAERADVTRSVRARLPRLARRQFDLALRSAIVYSQGRERSKTTIVTALHAFRLAALELGRRAAARGGPADPTTMWLVTADELDAYLADPPAFRAVQDERAARRDELAALVPPFVWVGHQPDPSTWARRDGGGATKAAVGAVLQGIAGCPGIARGRARVVLDPSDPGDLGPGDVLIAPITDPSWTPLFCPAEAVVVDVGAQMSHAVIVSRELGIPCVVSVLDATTSIPDGALVEVDGSKGTVTVLETA